MSNETDNSEQSDEVTKQQFDIGAKLVEARENQNLTSQNIADEMNLTLSVIERLESNRFEQDIPLAFMRGYLCSYAKRVGVDVENICAEFDRQTGGEIEPIQKSQVVSSFKTRKREINSNSAGFKLLSAVIVFALVFFGAWEIWKRYQPNNSSAQPNDSVTNEIALTDLKRSVISPEREASTNENESILSELNLSESNLIESDSDESDQDTQENLHAEGQTNGSRDESLVSNDESGQRIEPALNIESSSTIDAVVAPQGADPALNERTASPAPKPQVALGPVEEVVFVFTADCWVRVTDASGEVMAVGLKKAGKVMAISGPTPINVTLGEPSAVSIEFKDELIDLSRFQSGRTARLTLN